MSSLKESRQKLSTKCVTCSTTPIHVILSLLHVPCTMLLASTFIIVSAVLSDVDAADVRLVNSANSWEGIIEIYDDVEQKWGPLCGYAMDFSVAKVICRQLNWDGYDDYYTDGNSKFDDFGSYQNTYMGYVYVNLACSGSETNIDYCYDQKGGSYFECGGGTAENQKFAGISCETGSSSDFSLSFNYFGWILMILFFVIFGIIIRKYRYRRLMRQQQQQRGQVVTVTNTGGVVVPPATTSSYTSPPTGSYPTQQADIPPQYNTVVPPPSSAAYPPQGGAPYPPQGGAPYPPQGGAPYPPQGGAPYPPQGGAPYAPQPEATSQEKYPPPPPGSYPTQQPYPASGGTPYPPPQGDAYTANSAYPPPVNPAYPPGNPNDAVPSMPPPSYDSVAAEGNVSGEGGYSVGGVADGRGGGGSHA